MKAGKSHIEIVHAVKGGQLDHYLVIRDIGPWTEYMSVTNNAEDVVQSLWNFGLLRHGMRLFYYDSANTLDELLHEDGVFTGFKPGPPGAAWGDFDE